MSSISVENTLDHNGRQSWGDGTEKDPTTSRDAFTKRLSLPEALKPIPNIPILPDHKHFSSDEFYERLQFHGLADCHLAKSLAGKCFWFSMIVIFVVVLVLGMKTSIHEYYTNPIKTSISITPTGSLSFPEVYICPANYIAYNQAYCILDEIRDDLKAYVDIQNFPEGMKFMNNTAGTWRRILSKLNAWGLPQVPTMKPKLRGDPSTPPYLKQKSCSAGLKTKNVSLIELKEMLLNVSFYAKEIFPHCEFQGQPLNCSKITKVVLDKEERVCYLIKVDKNQNIKGSGLRIFVDLQTDNYDTKSTFGSLAKGVVVRVGAKIDPIDEGGTLAGPGSIVRLNMEKREEHLINVKLSKTPQKCVELTDDSIFEIFEKPYSMPKCTLDCFFKLVLRQCHCLPMIDPDVVQNQFRTSKVCTKIQMLQCVQHLANQSTLTSACMAKCYLPCEMTKIKVATSSMNLGAFRLKRSMDDDDLFSNKSNSNISSINNPEYWISSALLLDISFSEMEYTSVRQSHATTLIQLISDLGGQTGLWLGASMFSFMQLIALCTAWCYKHLYSKHQQTPKDQPGIQLSENQPSSN